MARNLGLGSRLIRLFLLTGAAVAVFGLLASIWLSAEVDAGPFALLAGAAFAIEGVVCVSVLTMLASRKLLQRVNFLAAAMDRSADGDLTATVAVTSGDEIGMLYRNFNTMLEKLARVAGKVHNSIAELSRVSDDIMDVSRRGSSVAEIQFEGVNGTAEAVREISASVNEVAGTVEGLSQLSVTNVASIAEMSASMERMTRLVESLVGAVEEVRGSILRLAASERQIGSGVDSLMTDSRTTADLVADMDVSIKQVERNARETSTISETVRQDAETGKEAVEATIVGIGEIRSSARITFEAVENLSTRAKDIGRILQVIDELAEQTNLLALNASIIAAQAGEHGRGFAVVADQIKGLANRTSLQTREIAGIIKGVQEETARAVKAMSVSEQRIAEGERLSHRSGTALNKIVSSVQLATNQVDEIARTTVEQTNRSETMRRSMERVAEMIGQIARATRDQGESSEQIIAAAERMKGLSDQVLAASREQGGIGKAIAATSGDVDDMIASIRQACGVQAESSSHIVTAMESIRSSTESTREAARVMDGIVATLADQIDTLQQEMAGLKV
jgi:methyl-accepting chemotaxis protein